MPTAIKEIQPNTSPAPFVSRFIPPLKLLVAGSHFAWPPGPAVQARDA